MVPQNSSGSSVIVAIEVSSDEYLKWYRGEGRAILTKDILGRSVQFPANILQRFVTHQGISGIFRIDFSAEGKFRSISRLDDF